MALGVGGREATLASMSAEEYVGWQAVNAIEPIGRGRLDAAIAINSSLIAELQQLIVAMMSRGSSPQRQPQPDDFMPRWENAQLQETETEQEAAERLLKQWVGIIGAQNAFEGGNGKHKQ